MADLSTDPRALTAIAQWATRDNKPDAKARRTEAIVAMWRAGVLSPEEFEVYGQQGLKKQISKWTSGYYLKKFPQIDSTNLNLYSDWYRLLYPKIQVIGLPPALAGLGFVPQPAPPDQGAQQGAMPEPDAPTPSRGMGPFLLAAGGVFALIKLLGK